MNLMRNDKTNMPMTFGNFFDEFFNRTIGDFVGSDQFISQPSINVVENEDNYSLEVAAPGLNKKDFDINLDNDYLTISAKQEMKEEVKDEKFTRREFNYSTFSRGFRLPETVDATKIEAKYENGILRIALPKKEEAKKIGPKVIKIQ